ncbi:MAG: hypothetical protein JKP98_01655 [Rhodobacteraceae bacterium]|jgi:hypothetical protein|nr:hypothetical protein [Paracoccaceae bacterium]MBL4556375.1 hypothetical protein [Paracoccaceae bacterium]HBG98189.1 hypothetical protein [Paracoccaceae bacterium]
MRPAIPIPLCLLLLAGCASPAERCATAVLEDIRIIDALIVQTEATLARGYAIETQTVPYSTVTGCGGWYRGGIAPGFCTATRVRTREVPVAVDLDAERAKLASMQAERARKAQAAAPALARCAALAPDAGTPP